MKKPRTAEGQPYRGEIVAAMDESSPAAGSGIYYVISSVVTVDAVEASEAARSVVGDRKRPFHWKSEGPTVRNRMVEVLQELGSPALVYWRSAPRKGQQWTRGELLARASLRLAGEGIDHLVIESGDATTDGRDKKTLLRTFEESGVPFHYDWRSKTDPLVWLPDAVCGVVAAHLLGVDSAHFDALADVIELQGI